MKIKPILSSAVFCALVLLLAGTTAQAQKKTGNDTVHVLLIGNSFSMNAARFLPDLAKEGGKLLHLGRAEIGGCSMEKHWNLSQIYERDPAAKEGKPYKGGKSLKMLLTERKWDFVTIQQKSPHTPWLDSFIPYAKNLCDYIRSFQPDAEILLHQTWAYRCDAKSFGRIGVDQDGKEITPKNDREMWEYLRANYREIARQQGLRIMPVGDAMYAAASDRKYGYRPDPAFDPATAQPPALPDQTYSLHKGYLWQKNGKIKLDANHASDAGCFLGGLVWYETIFGESPARFAFVPEGIPADFAAFLKKTAHRAVQQEKKRK